MPSIWSELLRITLLEPAGLVLLMTAELTSLILPWLEVWEPSSPMNPLRPLPLLIVVVVIPPKESLPPPADVIALFTKSGGVLDEEVGLSS